MSAIISDEIIILNIKGSIDKSFKLYNNLPNYVLNCQVPVAAGGGIKNLYDIEKSIRNGADKVVIKKFEKSKGWLAKRLSTSEDHADKIISILEERSIWQRYGF